MQYRSSHAFEAPLRTPAYCPATAPPSHRRRPRRRLRVVTVTTRRVAVARRPPTSLHPMLPCQTRRPSKRWRTLPLHVARAVVREVARLVLRLSDPFAEGAGGAGTGGGGEGLSFTSLLSSGVLITFSSAGRRMPRLDHDVASFLDA